MGAARGTEQGPRTGSHTHVNQRKNTTEPGSGAGRAMDETRPRKPQATETGWTDWIRLQPTETKWMSRLWENTRTPTKRRRMWRRGQTYVTGSNRRIVPHFVSTCRRLEKTHRKLVELFKIPCTSSKNQFYIWARRCLAYQILIIIIIIII